MSDLPVKQEDHPAHDMPTATEDHRGTQLPTGRGSAWIGDMSKRNSNSSPMDQPMPVSPHGEGPYK